MSIKRREIIGLMLIALGLFILLSLISHDPMEEPSISKNVVVHNWMGIIGVFISHYLIKYTLGAAAFIFPVLIILWGWWVFARRNLGVLLRFTLYISLLALIVATALALPAVGQNITSMVGFRYSGLVGGVLAKTLHDFLGFYGTIIILALVALITVRGYFSWSFYGPLERLRLKRISRKTGSKSEHPEKRLTDVLPAKSRRKKGLFRRSDKKPKPVVKEQPEPELTDADINRPMDPPAPRKSQSRKRKSGTVAESKTAAVRKMSTTSGEPPQADAAQREYNLPSVDLLDEEPADEAKVSRDEMMENAQRLEEALTTFKVEGKVVNVAPGPIITRYEIEPASGVRVSKIAALSDDLARILKAKRIRIVAPIPGKSVVGVEIPNRHPATVFFRSVVESHQFKNSTSKLTIALGKTIAGDVYTVDLSKMPHLLIAGATGSGKSVCINMIISSILYRAKPNEVKFVLVDPKKLELSTYKSLVSYHLITSEDLDEYVVTRADNAIVALRSIEMEMERRYDILSGATVRNIEEYNKKVIKGHLDKEYLPYIVIVIDELADLMVTSAKEVEDPITRLAQMARAVGIHLIIATQRPSVDVITGVIKANFPARIAFQVTSKIDSRTILDINGAEKLLGRGDLLLTTPQSPEPKRLHSAYISLDELNRILEHISAQPKPEEMALPSVEEEDDHLPGDVSQERDELFDRALRLVVTHQQGSASLLQRRLRIGYARAARIIDQLEDAGIVGPFTGSKARDVLVDENYLEDLGPQNDLQE